jgi:hypothetical protein
MLNKKIVHKQFEKVIFILTGGLFLAVLLLIFVLSSLPPRVLTINLLEKQILITFNRDMDRRTVEENFSLNPVVPGKFSWAGRNFAFTLDHPLPYGQTFEVNIKKEAHDDDGQKLKKEYVFKFQTPPFRFAYIGVEGEEQNRLILSNLDGTERKALTDGSIKIEQYQFCPEDQCVYFLGYKENLYQDHRSELYLLELKSGKVRQITNDQHFINKSFRLSPDGQTLAIIRIQIGKNDEYVSRNQIWTASIPDHKFALFQQGRATGINAFFTPDSSTLLYLNQDYSYEIAPLYRDQKSETQYLGTYDGCYGFHPYRPLVAFTKQKTDTFFVVSNDLVLYSGDGATEKIPKNDGLFRDTVFTPDGQGLVTIFSGPTETFEDKESLYPLRIFHLYTYDFETKKLEQLTSDFDYSEENPTISPDSKYLLFQRYETFSKDLVLDPAYRDVADSLGNVLSGGQIWMMDLETKGMKKLPMKGAKVRFVE